MNIILSEIRPDGAESPEQTFEKTVLRIGRDPFECDIAFDKDRYTMVSRSHAELRWNDGKWWLIDLTSSYGTFVDGRRIEAPECIRAGNVLQFGENGPALKVVWFEALADSLGPAVEPPKPAIQSAQTPEEMAPFAIPQAAVRPKPPAIAAEPARLEFVEEPGCDVEDRRNPDIAPGLVVEPVHDHHERQDADREVQRIQPPVRYQMALIIVFDKGQRSMPDRPEGPEYQAGCKQVEPAAEAVIAIAMPGEFFQNRGQNQQEPHGKDTRRKGGMAGDHKLINAIAEGQ